MTYWSLSKSQCINARTCLICNNMYGLTLLELQLLMMTISIKVVLQFFQSHVPVEIQRDGRQYNAIRSRELGASLGRMMIL